MGHINGNRLQKIAEPQNENGDITNSRRKLMSQIGGALEIPESVRITIWFSGFQ